MSESKIKVDGFGDYDVVGAIMDYEDGDMDSDQIIELFQHLVDTDMAWTLQGQYGRTATLLLRQGVINPKGDDS